MLNIVSAAIIVSIAVSRELSWWSSSKLPLERQGVSLYGNASWMMGDKTSHSALFRLMKMKKQLNPAMPWIILNEGEQASF